MTAYRTQNTRYSEPGAPWTAHGPGAPLRSCRHGRASPANPPPTSTPRSSVPTPQPVPRLDFGQRQRVYAHHGMAAREAQRIRRRANRRKLNALNTMPPYWSHGADLRAHPRDLLREPGVEILAISVCTFGDLHALLGNLPGRIRRPAPATHPADRPCRSATPRAVGLQLVRCDFVAVLAFPLNRTPDGIGLGLQLRVYERTPKASVASMRLSIVAVDAGHGTADDCRGRHPSPDGSADAGIAACAAATGRSPRCGGGHPLLRPRAPRPSTPHVEAGAFEESHAARSSRAQHSQVAVWLPAAGERCSEGTGRPNTTSGGHRDCRRETAPTAGVNCLTDSHRKPPKGGAKCHRDICSSCSCSRSHSEWCTL